MPSRKAFLLRIDPAILDAIQRWADDDLRSLNGQIEFVLRKALRDSGRMKPAPDPTRAAIPNSARPSPEVTSPAPDPPSTPAEDHSPPEDPSPPAA